GLTFSWFSKCGSFEQSCRKCQCTTAVERRELELLLSLKAVFHMSSHLVLNLFLLAPLLAVANLIGTCIWICRGYSIHSQEGRQRFFQQMVDLWVRLKSICCRGSRSLGGFVVAFILIYFIFLEIKWWQAGTSNSLMLGPVAILVGFSITSSLILYWHHAAKLRSALQGHGAGHMDIETEHELSCCGCRCFLCCLCCCNPLGCCFPMEVLKSNDHPPAENTTAQSSTLLGMPSLFFKEDSESKQERATAMSRYDELSLDSSNSMETQSMLWLSKLFVAAGSNRRSHIINLSVMIYLTFWSFMLAGTSWAYQNMSYGHLSWWPNFLQLNRLEQNPFKNYSAEYFLVSEDMKTVLVPEYVLPPTYEVTVDGITWRLKIIHDHLTQIMPVLDNLGDFSSRIAIFPSCLALHIFSLVFGIWFHFQCSKQRLKDWLRSFGSRKQWQSLYDPMPDHESSSEHEEIAGFDVQDLNMAAFPSCSEAMIQVVVHLVTILVSLLCLSSYSWVAPHKHSADLHGFVVHSHSLEHARLPFIASHMQVVYLLIWFPIVPYRLVNGLFLSADYRHLVGKTTQCFYSIEDSEMPPQEVKERLEIIEWKVRDIQHEWFLIQPACLILDLMALVSGLLAIFRLVMHWEIYDLVPLLAANCITLLVFVVVELKPTVDWNSFLASYQKGKTNVDTVLFIWLSQGFLNAKMLGLTLTPAYFTGLALSAVISLTTAAFQKCYKEIVVVISH
ncbi:Mitogen-activated protein kinase kinase kinase A, partial [Durusdinium trenchii]